MSIELLKAGYAIIVTSYENDGDNYKDNIVSGLSLTEVNGYLELLKPFTRSGTWGNDNVDDEDLDPFVYDVVKRYGMSFKFESGFEAYTSDMTSPRQLLNGLLGTASEGYDSEFMRMCDDIKILVIPADARDVIAEFIK